jgi:hypothetical protein
MQHPRMQAILNARPQTADHFPAGDVGLVFGMNSLSTEQRAYLNKLHAPEMPADEDELEDQDWEFAATTGMSAETER